MSEVTEEAPRVFISYCWSSEAHKAAVKELADRLIGNGVDVKLDIYNLKPGNHTYTFMESMVTDPSIKKVLVICDQEYARKANAKTGGVGAESQIISAEIYGKVGQEKFIPVIFECDPANGHPFVPVFMSSVLYFDMSSEERKASGYEELLRNIIGQPRLKRPPLGKMPKYMTDETTPSVSTRFKFQEVTTAIHAGRAGARVRVKDYLQDFAAAFEEYRTEQPTPDAPSDEQLMVSLRRFLPARDEFIALVDLLAIDAEWNWIDLLHEFFEDVTRFWHPPANTGSWRDSEFDNYSFITYELFLYTIAVLFKREKTAEANILTEREYFIHTDRQERTHLHFSEFRRYIQGLERDRRNRLAQRSLSITADLFKERATNRLVPFEDLMEIDFMLFLKTLLNDNTNSWFPITLALRPGSAPFQRFQRAESNRHFGQLKFFIGVTDRANLLERWGKLTKARDERLPIRFRDSYHYPSVPQLGNFDKIGSRD